MTDDNSLTREDFGVTLTRMVEEAFGTYPEGKEFMFQVSVNMQVAAPMVFIWLRSAVLGGDVMRGGFSIDNPFTVDVDEVKNAVRTVCTQMLNARSQQLAQNNGKPPANGHPLLGGQ